MKLIEISTFRITINFIDHEHRESLTLRKAYPDGDGTRTVYMCAQHVTV